MLVYKNFFYNKFILKVKRKIQYVYIIKLIHKYGLITMQFTNFIIFHILLLNHTYIQYVYVISDFYFKIFILYFLINFNKCLLKIVKNMKNKNTKFY